MMIAQIPIACCKNACCLTLSRCTSPNRELLYQMSEAFAQKYERRLRLQEKQPLEQERSTTQERQKTLNE
jgi:hypothetical protein